MWSIGDTVKITRKTEVNGEIKELLPIGMVCKIVEVRKEDDGTHFYGIIPIDKEDTPFYHLFYYLEKELERGRLKWIPDVPHKVGHNYTDEDGHYRTEYLGTYESKEIALDVAKKLAEKLPKEGEDDFDRWENYFVKRA